MNVTGIKTRKILPPSDSIDDLLKYVPKLKNGSIVAISSKVVSICEGHTKPVASIEHDKLVASLADSTLQPSRLSKNGMILTQVGNLLVESSGVDVSNANGYYVLLPKNPYKSAKNIWLYLCKRDKVKNIGIVITDSHSVPRRKGAVGFALASYGFKATHVYENKKDIFGKEFKFTASDVADSLAASAVLVMGEGDEITPMAVIADVKNIDFFKKVIPISSARRYSWVHPDLDVYSPLLSSAAWRK